MEAAIREALAVLAEHGCVSVADDVRRILVTTDLRSLGITRHPGSDRIIEAASEAVSPDDLLACLVRTAELVGAQHATIHVVFEVPPTIFRKKVITTYPTEWVERYVARRYYLIDPIPIASIDNMEGFYWSDLVISDPLTSSFLNDARENMIGPSGFSKPFKTDHEDILSLSIASTLGQEDFRNRFEKYRDDIGILAIHLGEAFVRLMADNRPAHPHLNDAQILALRAISRGEDRETLGSMTFDGHSFAYMERSICLLLGAKTIAQAAVLAAQCGLLDDTPLSRPDILNLGRHQGVGRL